MHVTFLLLVCLLSAATVEGQFFDFFNTVSPTRLITNFKNLITMSRKNVAAEIELHREIIAGLEEVDKFAQDQEKVLDEVSSSLLTLAMNSFELYGIAKRTTESLVERAKFGAEKHRELNTARNKVFISLEKIFKPLRDVMQYFDALEDELPPMVIDIWDWTAGGNSPSTKVTQGSKPDQLISSGFEAFKEARWAQALHLLKLGWDESTKSCQVGLNVVEYAHRAAFKVKNYKEALDICERALASLSLSDEERQRLEEAKNIYLNAETAKQLRIKQDQGIELTTDEKKATAKRLVDGEHYKSCRKEESEKIIKQTSSSSKVFCRYDNRNRHPLLMYSPVKEEFVSVDPMIILFHDLVTTREADRIRQLASSNLRHARRGDSQRKKAADNKQTALEYRNADIYPIPPEDMMHLSRRIEAHTGLVPYDRRRGAFYEVSRYDISGHYIPHVDTLRVAHNGVYETEELRDHLVMGTLIIYLNEPEEGGNTVFTDLKKVVAPEMNAGLMWYTTHRNETLEIRSLHAGCPILNGEKWILTKWFRLRNQIFHRPCAVDPHEPYHVNSQRVPDYLQYQMANIN